MQGARGGYTIIEVLIVLFVTTALFVSAITVFNGKQGKTEFSQSMQDLNSKIQSVISDINVSVSPGGSQTQCNISGNLPLLAPSGTDTTGANGDCLFLGKALQADTNTNQGHIYIYTVLGLRINPVSGNLATTYANATPDPAMGQGGCSPTCDLTEDYYLPYGSTIKSSKISTNSSPPSSPTETDLVGIYNSLQATSSGSQSLQTLGYNKFTTNTASPRNQVRQALQGNFVPSLPINIQGWYLCIQSGSSNEKSELVVSASPAGVTTKINYGVCS